MKKLSVLAPAKVNLYLNVCAKRADGYHDIESVMQTVSLFDRLTVIKNDANGVKNISLSCRDHKIPSDERNLVYRAALRFFAENGITEYDVSFILEKKIPSEAGLGGGSSDAAATLLALDRLYETGLSLETLCAIGAKIGADVPFCVKGGAAYADGRGERLKDIANMPECYIAVACEGEGVSTPWAYGMLDKVYNRFADYEPRSTKKLEDALEAVDIFGVSEAMFNIFEAPVLSERPVAADVKRLIEIGRAHV